jgi:hypothetical protein
MGYEKLHDYLSRLPKRIYADHTTLLTSDLLEFLTLLGYPGSTVFFQFLMSVPDRIIADAVVAEERMKPLHLIIQVRTWRSMMDDYSRSWKQMLLTYKRFLKAPDQSLILFSPKILGKADRSGDKLYDLTQISPEDSRELYEALKGPVPPPHVSGTGIQPVGPQASLHE